MSARLLGEGRSAPKGHRCGQAAMVRAAAVFPRHSTYAVERMQAVGAGMHITSSGLGAAMTFWRTATLASSDSMSSSWSGRSESFLSESASSMYSSAAPLAGVVPICGC